jgi:hypothetical protein
VHGDIDRIDLVPDTTPTQLVVRDYKTGNVPGEKDTLLGLRFQLPLYALLAEDALEDVEVVGGAYYQVKPPGEVSSRRGQVTSKEMVEWEEAEEIETPLVYRRKPVFETQMRSEPFWRPRYRRDSARWPQPSPQGGSTRQWLTQPPLAAITATTDRCAMSAIICVVS